VLKSDETLVRLDSSSYVVLVNISQHQESSEPVHRIQLLTKSTFGRKFLSSLDKLEKTAKRYHHGDLERALIATSLDVIGIEGVDGLTLRRVGAKVGVSRSALYRHFDDKAALVARIASDGFRLLHETLMRVRANAAPDANDTLEVMAAAHVHFAQANPSHYATMFGGFIKDWRKYPELARHADAAFGEVVDAIRGAQRGGSLASGDPIPIAQVMWALTFGVAQLGTSGQLARPSLPVLAVQGVRWVSDGCQIGI
jgi:AcrR family transcriptional regulator